MNQLILTAEEGAQLYSFEGKHVVPVYAESANYREWDVSVNHTRYGIIQEGDVWTLMYFVPDINGWIDAPDQDVDTFLTTNKLILAA